jgi:hypothetical protein
MIVRKWFEMRLLVTKMLMEKLLAASLFAKGTTAGSKAVCS